MNEQIITLETAILLQELKVYFREYSVFHYDFNYDETGESVYVNDLDITIDSKYFRNERLSFPPQEVLHKWLRDNHKIFIELRFDTETFGYRLFNPFKIKNYYTKQTFGSWTYEQAYEEGLKHALNILKLSNELDFYSLSADEVDKVCEYADMMDYFESKLFTCLGIPKLDKNE
ncbi:MAG: hypothetical protein ACOC2W_03795 [bacterium]